MLDITVDPALALYLIRVFAALGCIAFSGFLIVYFAFSIRHLLTAIATALPIGLAAVLLVSNLLAYVLGTPRALTWGVLAVLAAASAAAILRRGQFRPLHPTSWLDGGLYMVAGIALLIISVANYAVLPTSSYYMHFWLANTIRFGNFPVKSPGAPLLRSEYHYGVDFLAAVLAHIGQLDSAIVFFILTPLVATSAYLAASVLAGKVLGSPRLGLLAGLFFSFSAGLPFLAAPARTLYLEWFPPDNAAARDELSDYLLRISPNTFEAYPQFINSVHYIVPWAMLLACMAVFAHLEDRKKNPGAAWYHWGLLGLLFGAIALLEESVFALGLGGWAALALWQTVVRRKPRFLRNFASGAVPAVLLALLQGGLITDALFFSAPQDDSFFAAFQVHVLPQFTRLSPRFLATEIQSINPAPWALIYLILLGLPLLLAPVLVAWALVTKRSATLLWLGSLGGAGFLIPHFVSHAYSTNFLRWQDFALVSFALLLGIGTTGLFATQRNRYLAWILALACIALTVVWPISSSLRNVFTERHVSVGRSVEDHLTLSPPLRQVDQADWVTGRPQAFRMSGEARQFLQSLPASARVLTNSIPEVPLMIRGLAPHKNPHSVAYANFRYPSATYLDALYALDPEAMHEYGITHLVVNLAWFRHADPETHATLENPRFFSQLFTDEATHEGNAWHRVYEVLPAFYAERPSPASDLVRSLAQLVPANSSIYISPAIPADIRWAFIYTLRHNALATGLMDEHHIKASIVIAEPGTDDAYDFALLIDEDLGDRWINWGLAAQDLPSVWGFQAAQAIWHALGVSLFAVNQGGCPNRAVASIPASWQLAANSTTTLDLDCLQNDAESEAESSLLLTIFAADASTVDVRAGNVEESVALAPGATLIPLQVSGSQQVTLTPTAQVWVRAQLVPAGEAEFRTGVPAIQIVPTLQGQELDVDVRFYGERGNPVEDQVVWELVKQRRIYGHWWHWDSPSLIGAWRLLLDAPPDHGSSFGFRLHFDSLTTVVSVDGQPKSVAWEPQLPENPGEPYVLYFTLFRPGARVQSVPVAWINYGPEEDPKAVLAPRFILLDESLTQD